jgi:hypothetical protein
VNKVHCTGKIFKNLIYALLNVTHQDIVWHVSQSTTKQQIRQELKRDYVFDKKGELPEIA